MVHNYKKVVKSAVSKAQIIRSVKSARKRTVIRVFFQLVNEAWTIQPPYRCKLEFILPGYVPQAIQSFQRVVRARTRPGSACARTLWTSVFKLNCELWHSKFEFLFEIFCCLNYSFRKYFLLYKKYRLLFLKQYTRWYNSF